MLLPKSEERVLVSDLLKHPWITKEPGFIKLTLEEMSGAFRAKQKLKSTFHFISVFSRIFEANKIIMQKKKLEQEKLMLEIQIEEKK